MRFAIAISLLIATVACGDPKPPMVPDNTDLSQPDGGDPAVTPTSAVAPTQ